MTFFSSLCSVQAKIAVLEERLAEKKEDLLERELVHEEVATLSKKLREQATDGREDTLKLVRAILLLFCRPHSWH